MSFRLSIFAAVLAWLVWSAERPLYPAAPPFYEHHTYVLTSPHGFSALSPLLQLTLIVAAIVIGLNVIAAIRRGRRQHQLPDGSPGALEAHAATCRRCQKDLPPHASFCPRCGVRLDSTRLTRRSR